MTLRARQTTWVASREWPPSSKKSSCTPTRSSPSTSPQIPARISSSGLLGPTAATSSTASGPGSARRSTFPFAVSGSSSSLTTACGTSASGSRSLRCSCSSLVPTSSSPLPTT